MNHLNDELINKYFDNDLSISDINKINEHIKICADCLNKIKAQKLVEGQLKNLPLENLSYNFTESLMSKIQAVSVKHEPKKNYFFRFIFSVFIFMFLGIFIFAASGTHQNQNEDWFKLITNNSSAFFNVTSNLFSKIDSSIFTSVLAFIVLISIYYFYETTKTMKNNFSKG